MTSSSISFNSFILLLINENTETSILIINELIKFDDLENFTPPVTLLVHPRSRQSFTPQHLEDPRPLMIRNYQQSFTKTRSQSSKPPYQTSAHLRSTEIILRTIRINKHFQQVKGSITSTKSYHIPGIETRRPVTQLRRSSSILEACVYAPRPVELSARPSYPTNPNRASPLWNCKCHTPGVYFKTSASR